MTLGTAAVAFAAGFVSVLIFHQGMWALFRAAGLGPGPAWNFKPIPPLGVPGVISSAFWGGLWGIVLLYLLPLAAPSMGYWAAAIVLGALMTSAVALFVVAPLKGRPFAAGWDPKAWAFALSVNAAWGFGFALLLRGFNRYFG
jgi:hypothetical protein